ncbi:ubiquitin-binding WIYLD domain protein [Medicago truncatula]|uniref:Ubiquitin-binding WIYLD domain protein n=1 Tax=Medicago truncatula TaxID=3880 RepID=A0A072VR72_MEDTR|nr:ubiquitin-binding WIYLD domain protein [Medicago truncatula]
MEPSRRPLKKGGSRMDAALDAMTALGFDKKVVHQTVNKLLKVYGSNEGWVFIEDGDYRLLIDQLLEAQQQDQEQIP